MEEISLIDTGLVSITFRKLSVTEVVDIVVKSGLNAIEWGGDIHVPSGDFKKAKEVKKITEESGLYVASYGSYYRLACGMEFEEVLETAIELKAPTIRVWAGNIGSDRADKNWWDRVINETNNIANLADKANINIDFEYHGNTLTDTSDSAFKLLKQIEAKNVGTYWQPSVNIEDEERMRGLKLILPWLRNIHAFYWLDRERYPLEAGRENWIKYLTYVAENNINSVAMLEFVKGDSIEQFYRDAETLKDIVNQVNDNN